MNPVYVFAFASITALCTGLGALPFAVVKNPTKKWMGIFNAMAAGLMLAASGSLLYEGIGYGVWKLVLGMFIGLLFVWKSKDWLEGRQEVSFAKLDRVDARKVLMILLVMTVHSFTEGVGVGVSFSGSEALGQFITAAIAIHNIPEGLAIALIMVPRGTSVFKASLWAIFSSLPQPLMAVPAFLFVEWAHELLPVGLGFAGGAMIWMVFSEILPEVQEDISPSLAGTVITLSIAAMLIFQSLVG
jgi:zinc transporter ZupT